MLLWLLALLVIFCYGLRFESKRPSDLWHGYPIDVVSLILHSMNVRLLSHLTYLLRNPDYPLRMIYDVGCYHHMDQRRLHDLLRSTKWSESQRSLVIGVECIYNTEFANHLNPWIVQHQLPYSLFELAEPDRLSRNDGRTLLASRSRDLQKGVIPMTTCSWLTFLRPSMLKRKKWSFRQGHWEYLMPECWEEVDYNLRLTIPHQQVTLKMTKVMMNVSLTTSYLKRCMRDGYAVAPLFRLMLRMIMIAEKIM